MDKGGPVRPSWNAAPLETSLPPNILGYFNDQFQFGDLILNSQLITQHRARKTTLGTDSELLQRHDLARIIDAPLEIIGPLQCPALGGHETKVQSLMRR
jgi:hypothetical protein